MAPSSNATRPRTGSLSLRHSSSTVRNYYGNNTTAAAANSAANNYYGSKPSSGIERSYNSITNNLKGKISSLDSSLDSSKRGSLNSSVVAGSMQSGSMKSESGRSSMNSSKSSMNSSRSSLNSSSRRNSNETTRLRHTSSQSQTTSSSSFMYQMEGRRYQDEEVGVSSIPSFASTSTNGGGGGGGGIRGGGGVESIQSTTTSSTINKTDSERRSSLREIKAALRQEKLHGTLSFDDTVTTSDSVRRMLQGGGGEGMESVPSYESSSTATPSFESKQEERSVLEESVVQEGGNGRLESVQGSSAHSDERCQLDELWNDNGTNQQHCGGGQLDTVQETAVVAAVGEGGGGGGRMSNGQGMMIVNQRSYESLDTFRKDTSTTTTTSSTTANNNSNTSNNNSSNKYKPSRGSAGLYSANLTSKKTPSKAVSKMSQASFGKIRDILSGGEGHAGTTTTAAATGCGAAHRASTSNNNSGGNNATTATLMGGYRESGIGLGGILQYGRNNNNNNSADEEMSFFVSDTDGKVHKEHHQGVGNTTTTGGGKRESGLGGILQFGGGRTSNNSADEEMSFFVSDDNGKVHKEKVPLVNKEGDDGDGEKKVLLLEQDKFQLGKTMKVTNVSRGGGGEKKTKPTVSFQQQQQQQQQRSVFHTKREDETKMSTAPQSPIHDPSSSGHTPPLVRSVKKASRAVSHSMKTEVVPAAKTMAALTAKYVERGEKKMVDNVAPKLRAVALDIDSRLHPKEHQQNNGDGGFVGLQHIDGKGDYVCDPDYHVVPTPQHADQMGRRAYGPNAVHNFDPNTPACLLGALTAGTMFNYDITHPEHPEYLPEGMPRELDVPGDWEERAGFVPVTALVEKKKGVGPVDLDEEVENDEESVVRVEEMLALQQAVAMSHKVDQVAEEEAEEEVTDEEDARNASMWVAYNPEEDMEEEDEIMNVGEIIIATGGELGGEDNEFSPRSLDSGDSDTYHVGDLSLGINSDDADEQQKETAIVTFQQDQEVHVETFEDDNGENEDEVRNNHPVEEHYAATPMKKVTYENGETPSQQQQQQFTDKKKEFQTPFSVKKGERPLTFDEFRAMNRRVLFDNEEQAQPTEAMVNVDIGRNTEVEEQPQRQMTVEKFVSASSRYEQSGKSQRELKGRVVMIRIKKKISKAVKKALKSILLTAKIGRKTKSSNNSISDIVITIPEPSAVPDSPSAVSIASSLLSAAISGSSKRVIGAAPFSSNINAAPEYLYGAVNYHNRPSEDGSVDESEQLPPPPRMTSNQISDHDDEDVVSFLAEAMNQGMNIDRNIEEVLAIEDEKEVVDEEEQMYLVLTPSEGGDEKVSQVISGKVDGTPVVFNEIMLKNEEGSEIKPHNLSIMFDSGKKESTNESIQIMDAVEAVGNIVLTPTESNQNVGDVFRRTSTDEASASILQSSSEDETLVTHDGNTLVRLDTKDSHDHTINTTTSLRKEEEKKPLSTFELAREDDPKDVGNSPIRPAYSRQAASNASFLFSPNNMGRADPSIRARERAMMRNQSHGGSITMLPSASSIDKSEQQLVLKPKPSYSFDSSAGGDTKYGAAPSIASGESSQEPDTPSTIATAVQKKPVMASMTKDRQFSFKTILNQFSTDALDSNDHVPRVVEQKHVASPERDFGSSESQSKTPLVTNAVRKKYAGAPFTKAEGSTSSNPMSPSSSSISSKSKRLSSPKGKTIPKSAARTRTGLVKDRISMFQQRVDAPSAVTGVNGRLKRNHSYRLKNERRETNGGGALAPRKAVLKSAAFIRTVPIGISKSYSRDDAGFGEIMNKADAGVEQTYTQNDSSREDDDSIEKPNSYVKQYTITSKVNEEAESFGRGSLDSSTCVSEATEFDAFNSLLGKFDDDDDDSSVESETSEETLVTDKQKENAPNALPSTSPFKQRTLVKPNEINHNRTPLTAQKWRSLAATHGKSSKKLVMKY